MGLQLTASDRDMLGGTAGPATLNVGALDLLACRVTLLRARWAGRSSRC
jgi:hypothetical protein